MYLSLSLYIYIDRYAARRGGAVAAGHPRGRLARRRRYMIDTLLLLLLHYVMLEYILLNDVLVYTDHMCVYIYIYICRC